MLKVYFPVLMLLWVAGMAFSFTLSGLIHILPLIAIALLFRKFSSEHTTRPGDTGPRLKKPKTVRS